MNIWKRGLALLLCLLLCLGALPGTAWGTEAKTDGGVAAENARITDNGTIRSEEEGAWFDEGAVVEPSATAVSRSTVEAKLAQLAQTYPPGSTWTGSFAGGIQCYGFAKMILYHLFGKTDSGAYRSWNYAGDSLTGLRLVDQIANYSESTVKNLLSKAAPGDLLQFSGGTKSQHSMIVYSVSSTSVCIYECNWDNACGISKTDISFAKFANRGTNRGKLSLIRADNYDVWEPIEIDVRASTTKATSPDVPAGGVTFNQGDVIFINGRINSGGPMTVELYVTPPGGTESGSPVDSVNNASTWFWLGSGADGYKLTQSGTYFFRLHAISGGNTKDYAAQITSVALDTTVHVTGVSLDKSALELQISSWQGGTSGTLSATVYPSNATDKSLTWSSSNTNVATVDGNGTVTATGPGSATITVRTNDGGKTASCAVTVVQKYYLDLNGCWNGENQTTLAGLGTADVYVNGVLQADDVEDYYVLWPAGTTYEFRDIKPYDSRSYNGIASGARQGTINGDSALVLDFTPINTSGIGSPAATLTENGHIYRYYSDAVTWYTAKQFCEEQGGHLATVSSDAENTLLRNLIGNNLAWLGGTCISGSWKWVTGEAFSFGATGKTYPWKSTEPNDSPSDEGGENYLHFSETLWNDNAGCYRCGFLFEKEVATYTIQYNANGGTGAPAAQTKTQGVPLTLSSTVPTRSGYTFLGWAESQSAKAAQYQPSGSFTKDANTTLYAVWKAASTGQESDGILTVESVRARPGQEVTVGISFTNNPGVMVMALGLDYDSSKLTLTGFEDAGFTGWSVNTAAIWLGDSNSSFNGTILKLKFRVADNAPEGDIPVTLRYAEGDIANAGGTPLLPKCNPGKVTVSNILPGDITGDGKVNAMDLLRLKKYLAGDSVTLVGSGDITGDGKINAMDLLRLKKYLAGDAVVIHRAGEPDAILMASGQEASLSVSTASGGPGDTVTLDISIANNPGIMVLNPKLNFNTDVLEYVGYEDAGLTGWAVTERGMVWIGDGNSSFNGVILKLKLKVKDSATSGLAEVTLICEEGDAANEDEEIVPISVTGGGVNVSTEYKIKYNANGGTGAPSTQTKIHGVDLTLSKKAPTREGYTFLGWAENKSATEAQYQPGGKFTKNANTTLYAVWMISTYTVKYNANGGTGAPAAQTKTHGVALTLRSEAPSRTGYNFKGWAETADATEAQYQPGDPFTKDADTTLYAVWQIKTYTVKYNANGGTGAPAAQTKTYGKALTLSKTVPTRSGFTFLGWAESQSATEAQYQPGGKYTKNASKTLYAVWTPNTYTVTYHANGGTGEPRAQTKTHGVALTLSSEAPSRTGYNFKGWAETADATEAQYQPGDPFTKDADTTLYAVWQIKTYTVKYNANGGTGAPAAQTKTYGKALTLSKTVPTRSGFTFLGWAESQSATEAQYQPGGKYTKNASKTLYAVWKAAWREEDGILTVESVRARPGAEVTVGVRIANNPGVMVMVLGLDYDSTKLSLTGYEDAGFTGWVVEKNAAWIGDKNSTFNGTILKLKFKVAENAAEEDIPITLRYAEGDIANASETALLPKCEPGKVTVVHTIPGDITGDGKVNAVDLLRLQKYLAGVDVTLVGSGDITGDGKINAMDLLRLKKYLAGDAVVIHRIGEPDANLMASGQEASLSVSTASGGPGDTVTLDISIADNPGIMVLNPKLSFNTDALEYVGYEDAGLTGWTVTERGMVWIGDTETDLNGVILKLKFHIKESAPSGLAEVTLLCEDGDAANENEEIVSLSVTGGGVIVEGGTDIHTHTMTHIPAQKPGCTEPGNIEYWYCADCGKYFTDEAGENEITQAETVIPPTGHSPGEAVHENEVPATCTEPGSYDAVVYCTVCGAELSRETVTVPALGHDWGDWTQTKAPTETEEGEETRSCKRCDATETRTIPPLVHQCEYTHVPAVEPSCTEPGNIEHWRCPICGKYYVGDKYDLHLATEDEVLLPALGHDWGDWTETKAPSCTEPGEETRTCKRDGTHKETREIPSTGHAPGEAVHENEVPATCTEPGSYDEVVYCTACGAELSRDSKTVPAFGHDWSDWTTTTEATCTEAGEESRSCKRCGETETRATSPLGHDWGAWTVTKEPTETEPGEESRVCARCGETETRQIPVAPSSDEHEWGDWEVTTKPGCTRSGQETRVCAHCGETETRPVEALGHRWGEWAVTKQPTATETGTETIRCLRCGRTMTRTVPCLTMPFTDVPEDAWYYEAVHKVWAQGLMTGVSDTLFAPGQSCERGMIVTILYRLAGAPEAGTSGFLDVAEGDWYADAVAWAEAEGIVYGYDETHFFPRTPITRQQLAAMLYRYAAWAGLDLSAADGLTDYADAEAVSGYALEAMRWAVAQELLFGTEAQRLEPDAEATRVQTAAALARFTELAD